MARQHNKRKGNMEGSIYNTCLALRDFKSYLLYLKRYYERYYECFKVYTRYYEVMELDLEILEMFFQGLAYWEDLEYDWRLRFSINTMMTALIRVKQEFDGDCDRAYEQEESMNWEVVMYDYKKTFQQLEAQARDICVLLLGGAYKCASCPSNQKRFLEYVRDTGIFTDIILQSLRSLQSSRLIAPALKQKFALIQLGLEEFRMFVDPPKILFDHISHDRAWINRISCLSCLFWIDGNDENLASAMETMLSGLLHEITPCRSSGVVSSFLQYTKNLQPLAGYLDLLLQDLVIPMKDEVYEGMIFLLSFVINSHEYINLEDSKTIWAQSFAAINKFTSLIYSLGYGEMEEQVCAVDPSDFLVTVDTVKARLRIFVVAPYSSEFPFPSTNVIGFLNSMIENLNEMLEEEVNCIPSLKHQGELLQEELMPLVRNTSEQLIDEDEEMRDLWTDISCTVYNADYFIKLVLPKGLFVWYGIAGLSFLIQAIESVKRQIDKLAGVDKKSSGHHDPVEGADVLQPRGTTSENEEVYVGFIEDKRVIIDDLTRGSNSLTIISISGSGGQGKTTLAKQIYNDPIVQYHFSKSCWCYISKDRPIKKILVQIISDVNKGDDRTIDVKNMGVQELAALLRKSLKGRRFFIVMDDIWDVEVWSDLELSFPDDKKGSRILFTSRNHDLASQAKSNSISHALPLFTDEESWELMKKRVFGSDLCDEEFVGIGKKIASYCKGLPLAVSLTAAVLGRTQQSLVSWKVWNQVAENLKRHLAEEGCGNVLKLSYTHLPEYLKSCFLYFRTFRRGEEVRAKELKLLWVGEGFVIPNGEAKFTETNLAAKYLNDLVSQGLVGVTEWSTTGGIKRCNVHDLLYDLCLEICIEDNYLTWVDMNNDFDLKLVNVHRILIGVTSPFISSTPSTKRALPMSPIYSLTFEDKFFLSIQHFAGSFKLLTVLNLKNTRLNPDIFLEVTSLIHLRYLAIHFWDSVTAIPLEIANLWKLGALILKCDSDITTLLPVSMWNRKSLRHVDIQRARLNLDEFDLGEPDKLFGGALYLEALGSLFLDVDDSRTTEFLRNFPNLRKLRCELYEGTEPIMKLLLMVVSLLQHLESLTVSGPRDALYSKMVNPNRNPVLWSLHKNENLIKLSLCNTVIPWSVVSEIGKRLPNLQVLKLLGLSCVGIRWKLEDGDFPKLIYLRLSSLWNLWEIDVSICDDPPFPSLEHLVLVQCRWLREIPSIFGEHCTLKRIGVTQCSQRVKNSAIRILKQQRDFGNGSFEVMADDTIEDEYYDSAEEDETDDDEYCDSEEEDETGNMFISPHSDFMSSFQVMVGDIIVEEYYGEDEIDDDEYYVSEEEDETGHKFLE